jgi:fructose-1,6-bisphosphatase I
MTAATLDAFLNSYVRHEDELRSAVAATIRRLAQAAIKVRHTVSQGRLSASFAGANGSTNSDGDRQTDLDVFADGVFLDALRQAPVAFYASEEQEQPTVLDPAAPLAVAIDPLDGSSNIDTNASIGTIFSFLPATGVPAANPAAAFLRAGTNQIGAGFFVYGPQLALVLSLGSGTHVFVFSTRIGTFVQSHESCSVPARTTEFAINAANYRHWDEAVRLYVDDCLEGIDGPRDKDFNMRWIGSLVAECYRILMRGGVFLYPGDRRRGYQRGRLRLVYEANPIAFLIEQAGGAATDTVNRILELEPESLHQRTPFVFGSEREVGRIARYHTEPSSIGERAPLFGNRGLFRP